LAAKIRSLKVHGAGSDKYNHIYVGLNSRLDTLQAAILLEKLKIFPKELEARQNVANFYTSLLKDLVEVPFVNEGYLSSWAQYTIKVPPSKREKLMSFLKAQGIPTMIYYPLPLHLQPAYVKAGGRLGDAPQAETLANEVLSLPMHPYLTEDEITRVANAIQEGLR
jgi:dTDP-4-amino-4,6-dideoxygalactose transaminase